MGDRESRKMQEPIVIDGSSSPRVDMVHKKAPSDNGKPIYCGEMPFDCVFRYFDTNMRVMRKRENVCNQFYYC